MKISEIQKRGIRLISFTFFVFALTWGSSLIAQRYGFNKKPIKSPYPTSYNERIQIQLKLPGVMQIASMAIRKSAKIGQARAAAKYEDIALDKLLTMVETKKFKHAEVFANALIDELSTRIKKEKGEDLKHLKNTREKSRFLLAEIYSAQKKFKSALYVLGKIKKTPVQDHVIFFRAITHEKNKQFSRSIRYYNQVMALNTSLYHRAKIRRARALFRAGRWSEAEPALRFVNAQYIQYPNRPQSLLEHALCLEKLKRPEDAANAFQQIFFDYPFRQEGKLARKNLEKLKEKKISPSEVIPARDLFLRYRKLRINKHWETAAMLFKELRDAHQSETKHSAFEHEIEFQLALVDFRRRRFDDALSRLKKLHGEFVLGHRAGLSQYLLFKYMASIYGLRGEHRNGISLIDRMTKGMKDTTRNLTRAEYWEKHGEYEKSFISYRRVWKTSADKKTWHYAWLLYKTGRLQSAYRLFRARAKEGTGRSRAKHLYWAARSLERANLHQEAYGTFASVSRAYSGSYYGIQAQNRLIDLEQRTSVHGAITSKAKNMNEVGDDAVEALDSAIEKWKAPPNAPLNEEVQETRDQSRHALWGLEDKVEYRSAKTCSEDSKASYCDAVWGNPKENTTLFTPLKHDNPEPQIKKSENLIQDEDEEKIEFVLGTRADAKLPSARIRFPKRPSNTRVKFATPAKFFWKGRAHEDFKYAQRNQVPGPWPKTKNAFDADLSYIGGRQRAAENIGALFPALIRSDWLAKVGRKTEAREAIRFVAEEFYELRRRTRPRRRPHALERLRWGYRIDNRRSKVRQFWGILDNTAKYKVPKKRAHRNKLLARQQEIYDRRQEIHTLVIDALKETGDYYFVRKLTLAAGGWRSKSPTGPARNKWMQIYPRAFPELVLPSAKKNKINPYLLWALMMVESSFNPDSISPANAMGLFQVIPRTGLKTAFMFKDHDFGALNLLSPDVAIEHGTFYLSSLIHKFYGQELLAIPGYNGGPHRIGDWLEMRGNMPLDEFIEEIPFDEARGYAKKVFRFLVLYLRIYEGTDTMYVGQNMQKNYRANPNF